tara:strand:- start:478 stop:1998 length:1521 start_codon:yes stop_codon:yes gene_type:complete
VDKKNLSKKNVLEILKEDSFDEEVSLRIYNEIITYVENCLNKCNLGNKSEENGIYLERDPERERAYKINHVDKIIVKFTVKWKIYDTSGFFKVDVLPTYKTYDAHIKAEIKIPAKQNHSSNSLDQLFTTIKPYDEAGRFSFKSNVYSFYNTTYYKKNEKIPGGFGPFYNCQFFTYQDGKVTNEHYFMKMDQFLKGSSDLLKFEDEKEKYKNVEHDVLLNSKINDFFKLLEDEKPNLDAKYIEQSIKKEYEDILEKLEKDEFKEKKEVSSFISDFVNDYDTDNNGKLDILENDGFAKLLKSNQAKIIEVDKSYIQKFVKLSLYIKTKSKNLQNTFTLIKDAQELKEINNLHLVFESQYHSYAVTIFESFKMMLSLVKDDLITFYETYEKFDQLKIFESNWESEVSKSLSDIKELNAQTVQQLMSISKQIQSMEESIVTGLKVSADQITASIDGMNESLTKELEGVNDKLWWNNVFQTIQIYQNRKTNQLLGKDYKLKLKKTDLKYLT